MNLKNIKLLGYIKKLKQDDYIYLGIILIFFITVIILFSLTVEFVSKNINNAFSADKDQTNQTLNVEQYELVAKKLHLTTENTQNTAPVVPVSTGTSNSATTTINNSAILDKKNITISILNSTTKTGVANTLAKVLADAGFSTPKTGNEKASHKTTTLLIKSSKSDYTSIILEILSKIYPNVVSTTTPESNSFDAVIIIGDK